MICQSPVELLSSIMRSDRVGSFAGADTVASLKSGTSQSYAVEYL
jgi:hypothetical protein